MIITTTIIINDNNNVESDEGRHFVILFPPYMCLATCTYEHLHTTHSQKEIHISTCGCETIKCNKERKKQAAYHLGGNAITRNRYPK